MEDKKLEQQLVGLVEKYEFDLLERIHYLENPSSVFDEELFKKMLVEEAKKNLELVQHVLKQVYYSVSVYSDSCCNSFVISNK